VREHNKNRTLTVVLFYFLLLAFPSLSQTYFILITQQTNIIIWKIWCCLKQPSN